MLDLQRSLALLLALSSLALAADAQRGRGSQVQRTAEFITCTPGSVQVAGARPAPSKNPIAEALELAGPGSVITVRPGDYPGFQIGFKQDKPWVARTSGGLPGRPIIVRGEGGVVIRPRPGVHDTISITQDIKNGHITFQNMEIEPGERAGIMFFKQGNKGHDGYHFEDVDIIGSWDHVANSGKKSKWAVWGHSLRDFQYKGVTRLARIENIRLEHAFYLQNLKGNVLLERIAAKRLGRTFCQFTARAKDGPVGVGNIVVRECEVEDIGLSPWDDHKGGSAFTVAGRVKGNVLFENNTYRAGFDRALRRLTRRGAPYGSGAMALWDGGERVPNGRITLRGNHFEFAEGCGDRPVVTIGGCEEILILEGNQFVTGGNYAALSLDPTKNGKPGGALVSKANGTVYIDKRSTFVGGVEIRGREATEHQLRALGERKPANARQRAEARLPRD